VHYRVLPRHLIAAPRSAVQHVLCSLQFRSRHNRVLLTSTRLRPVNTTNLSGASGDALLRAAIVSTSPDSLPAKPSIAPKLSDELRFALAEHELSTIELRDAACAFLDAVRTQGRSCDDARIELKAFVTKIRTARLPSAQVDPDDDRLLNHIIAWWQERSQASA
jgi:hypothetical protein